MNKETINVVLASDDNYAQPMGTSIYSALDNFNSEKYKVKLMILDGGISEISKKKLRAIGDTFSTEIVFKEICSDDFKGFPLVQYFSIVMYYRLLIPNLIPNSIEKVIYLDSDTLVLGNLAELYEHNIDGYYLGAGRDFVEASVLTLNCPFYKDIKKYFNSGVLLLNLKKMREGDFTKRIFGFLKENSHLLLYPDQDALNYFCIDSWFELDKKWNTQVDWSQQKIVPSPAILHYTTSFKPWHGFYHNYYQRYYMYYMKKAWAGYKIKPVSFVTAVKQTLKYIPGSVALVRFFKK